MWTTLGLTGIAVAHLPDGRSLSLAHGPGGWRWLLAGRVWPVAVGRA